MKTYVQSIIVRHPFKKITPPPNTGVRQSQLWDHRKHCLLLWIPKSSLPGAILSCSHIRESEHVVPRIKAFVVSPSPAGNRSSPSVGRALRFPSPTARHTHALLSWEQTPFYDCNVPVLPSLQAFVVTLRPIAQILRANSEVASVQLEHQCLSRDFLAILSLSHKSNSLALNASNAAHN